MDVTVLDDHFAFTGWTFQPIKLSSLPLQVYQPALFRSIGEIDRR